MDKRYQTKALFDRLATLLCRCSADEYKRRVDFLTGICNDWFLADFDPSESKTVTHLCNSITNIHSCHDDTPESSEDLKEEVHDSNTEERHCVAKSISYIGNDLSRGKARSSLRLKACPVCGKCFRLASRLAAHRVKHKLIDGVGESPYVCCLCSKRFTTETRLISHFYRHGKKKRSLFRCTICHWSSANYCELSEHALVEHGCTRFKLERVALNVVKLELASSPDLDQSSDNTQHSSEFEKSDAGNNRNSVGDNLLLNSRANPGFTRHANKRWRRAQNVKTVGRRRPSQDTSSLIHKWQMKYPDRKIVPHSCGICGKQFLQAVQLRKHMINHVEEETSGDVLSMPQIEFPYSCYVCRRHFLFANDLRRHLVSHSDERPHSCVVCQRSFKREDDLAKHMKTHRDVRPYECETCGERLETATKLRRHARRAHGNKYECTACGEYFTKRSALSRHKREQHTDITHLKSISEGADAPLPYMCDRCGKSFMFDSDLRNHIYGSHSRRRTVLHACHWCHREFSSTSHLASHERTHTGDRPYTCDTCGKQFTQSGSLNVHRRTHVQPQPFACDLCDQKFASKQYAKKHLAMRHGISSGSTQVTQSLRDAQPTLMF